MIVHLNKHQHDKLYPKVAVQQSLDGTVYGGEFCNWCGALKKSLQAQGKSPKLIIERIDNSKGYDDIRNLQLACKGCNRRKDPHRPMIMEREMTPEMIVNRTKEPLFRKWLMGKILADKDDRIERDIAIESGAEFCGISIQTTKNYLRKCLSDEGKFETSLGQYGETFIHIRGEAPKRDMELDQFEQQTDELSKLR